MSDGGKKVEVLQVDGPRLADQMLEDLLKRRPELAERPYVRAKVEGRAPDFAHRLPTPEQLARQQGRDQPLDRDGDSDD